MSFGLKNKFIRIIVLFGYEFFDEQHQNEVYLWNYFFLGNYIIITVIIINQINYFYF